MDFQKIAIERLKEEERKENIVKEALLNGGTLTVGKNTFVLKYVENEYGKDYYFLISTDPNRDNQYLYDSKKDLETIVSCIEIEIAVLRDKDGNEIAF